VDKGRQDRDPLDPALLSPIPGERGAATARGHRLQPRQPAASEPFAQNWSLTSLQQRLLKTGGQLIRYARYFRLQLAENYLTGPLFRQILALVQRLAWPPTRSRGKPGARRAIASGVSLWGMFVSEMCSGKGGTALLGARRAVSPNQQYRRPDGAVGTRQGGSGKQMVPNRQIPAWSSPVRSSSVDKGVLAHPATILPLRLKPLRLAVDVGALWATHGAACSGEHSSGV
jgi:hypothetical protein